MVSTSEMQNQLRRFRAGQISLDDLNEWLVDATWEIDPNDQTGARQLFGAVELAMAEHSNGHLDDSEFLQRLDGLLGVQTVVLGAEPQVTTGS